MSVLERNLALDLVRVTEAAAIASARTMGRGDSHGSDQAAVSAMRAAFGGMTIDATIVIGEGERDKAPMLYIGERVGRAAAGDPLMDIALDPLEGTRLCAHGQQGALSVIAMGPSGCFLHAPDVYMNKLAVGPQGVGVVDVRKSPRENIHRLAAAKGANPSELTVMVLDRPRHKNLIEEIRKSGARIRLISDGDVHGAIATSEPGTGIDLLLGIGGAPEGVLAAAALQCIGGDIQGQLLFNSEDQRERAQQMLGPDQDIDRVFGIDDLAHGDILFSATGVTSGEMLRGVRFFPGGCHTSSLVMRNKSGTVRRLETKHHFSRKPNYTDDGLVRLPENLKG